MARPGVSGLSEFTALNPSIPVLALPEGSWVRVSGSTMTLGGERGALWIVQGREAEKVSAGALSLPSAAEGLAFESRQKARLPACRGPIPCHPEPREGSAVQQNRATTESDTRPSEDTRFSTTC